MFNDVNYPPTRSASGIVVAIVDSGIDPDRLPSGTVLLPGVNLSGDGDIADTGDPAGHGTAVASTILRIAPGVRLLPVKTMNRRGVLREAALVESALAWIATRREALGIGIVCAAFADSSHRVSDESLRGTAVRRLIAELREAGVPTVAAAGNWYPEHRARSRHGMAWPAIIREAVSVGALAGREEGVKLANASQRLHASLGTGCSTTFFALPGEPGETSGAAAVVAGCLAALRQSFPGESVDASVVRLRRIQREVADADGLRWPTVDPRDLAAD
ncbi:S8 family serine peptidase [Paenibacillus glycinis]|uniref:S8 family serine peptidase n=1 Tax=Paenibacillus glycinis TaxID=2697035 RepID=A0ABW9XKN8_9BACL|nr:S8 family serine peptidase [Paenibacillus glycinis]NBD23165.1 S8 family serine peptidase [Paenibacillus glycinis]